MPRLVTSTHPDYDKRAPQWRRTRDAIEGEDAVKARREVYLPRLEGHGAANQANFEGDPYDAYRMRATWFGAPERTITGLSGAILRKPGELEWPGPEGAEDEYLKSVGAEGESWGEIVADTVETQVGMGRRGLLVDAAPGETNAPPFVATYEAEDVRDWDLAKVGGRMVPVMVVLRETATVFDQAGEKESKFQFRVLKLGRPEQRPGESVDEFRYRMELMNLSDQDLEEDFYFQEVWVERTEASTAKKTYVLDQVITPRMFGGRLLREIPFVFFNKRNTKPRPEKPTIYDLVNTCYSIYRNSADLEHGRHFTALPTAVVSNPGSSKQKFLIGSQVAWVLDKGGTATYLEFTGAGLGHLAEGIKDKKQEVAAIGARLLEEAPRNVEAEGTVKLRQSGERSVLSRLADASSEGFTRILRVLAEWMNMPADQASLTLNQDFYPQTIDPQLLTVLMAKLQAGLISYDTYFYQLRTGEIIPEGRTMEEELELIRQGVPGLEMQEDEDEPDEVETGPGPNGHTHTFRPGDGRTSEDDGHSHGISGEEGSYSIQPATSPGADEPHTHTVPGQGQEEDDAEEAEAEAETEG